MIAVGVFLVMALVGAIWVVRAPQDSPSEVWAAVLLVSSALMIPIACWLG